MFQVFTGILEVRDTLSNAIVIPSVIKVVSVNTSLTIIPIQLTCWGFMMKMSSNLSTRKMQKVANSSDKYIPREPIAMN
jgi:hypothetical protein